MVLRSLDPVFVHRGVAKTWRLGYGRSLPYGIIAIRWKNRGERICLELWVKEVENPILKPLDQWRDDLYGYWMVITDTQVIDGIKMAIARYYGTDENRILDLEQLDDAKRTPATGVYREPLLMKSKLRVRKHGEVFTPQWVIDNTDLMKRRLRLSKRT
jgi:hypothetical protein